MKMVPASRRIGRVFLAPAIVAVIAFYVLPWAATLPSVRERIRFNEQRQIDGGATFYTDQDFLMDLLEKRETGKE